MVKRVMLLFILFVLLAGCETLNSDDKHQTYYENKTYGYQFTYPDNWIGNIKYTEYEIHTEFFHADFEDEFGPIFHTTAHTRVDWEKGISNGGNVVLETEQYVITASFTVWGSECPDQQIQNCEDKLHEIGWLVLEADRDHFTPIEINKDLSSPRLPSSESSYVHLDFPIHGMEIQSIDVSEDYPIQTAIDNGDVIIGQETYHLEYLIDFIENIKQEQSDQVRVVHYTVEGDPVIRELWYDGNVIRYTLDPTRDTFARPIVINKVCSGMGFDITETYEDGELLDFGRSMAFYLTDCDSDEGKYIFHYVPLKDLSNEFHSEQTHIHMNFTDPYYSSEHDLTLIIENRNKSALNFSGLIQLEKFTGYVWNPVNIELTEGMTFANVVLEPGELYTLPIEDWETDLTKGSYRLCTLLNIVSEAEQVMLAAEFEVK